jgi:hypothetical protein
MWFATTFVVLMPFVVPGAGVLVRAEAPKPGVGVAIFVMFQLFVVLFLVSCTRTVGTAPGDVPAWLRSDGRSDLHSYSNLLQAVERKSNGSPRFCRKTLAYKPDRAHYSRETGRCVLQYQHFSPVLNSCIGFYNYKFYVVRPRAPGST